MDEAAIDLQHAGDFTAQPEPGDDGALTAILADEGLLVVGMRYQSGVDLMFIVGVGVEIMFVTDKCQGVNAHRIRQTGKARVQAGGGDNGMSVGGIQYQAQVRITRFLERLLRVVNVVEAELRGRDSWSWQVRCLCALAYNSTRWCGDYCIDRLTGFAN